jgi:nucleoside-diphosphate-sugar epimerase
MKKLLVLGATGFIGRNLSEYFASRSDVEVYGTFFKSAPLRHHGIRMLRADLTRREDIDRVLPGMDVVVQAAAVTSGSKDAVTAPYIHITDNAVMNSLVFRAAFEHAVPHVVFLSCSVMYHSSATPLQESDFDANREMTPSYFGGGWNKVYFEKMCEFYSRLGRNRYTVIRHSNIYGPYDKYDLEKSHVFGATVAKVMTAVNGKVVVWGSGEESRDLLHVNDLVAFVDRAIHQQGKSFALYNVGSGKAIRVKDLVRKIIDHSSRDLRIEHDLSQPTIPTSLCLDCRKAKAELGWTPEISLDEGIRMTLDWYRAHTPIAESVVQA